MSEAEFKIMIDKSKNNPNINLNTYIRELSGDLRLKYIDLYDFNEKGSIERIISDIDDKDIVYEILKYGFNNETNKFRLIYFYEYLPKEYKEKFFEVIKEKENNLKKNIIEPYNITDYLKDFDYKEKEHIIKDIIFNDFIYDKETEVNGISDKKRFTQYHFMTLLELFTHENVSLEDSCMYRMLQFLASKNNEEIDNITNKPGVLFNISRIIKLFYDEGYDIRKVLNYLIESNYIDEYSLNDLTKKLPEDVKKEVVSFTVDCFLKNDRNIDNYVFFNLLNDLKGDDVIELIDKYVIHDKIFDYIYPFRYINNQQYDNFYFSNVIISLLTKEEFEQYFKKIHGTLMLNETLPKYDNKYKDIVKVYSSQYGVDYSKLTMFIEKFGFSVLKYIDNSNFRKYMNMSNDEINKLFSIFDDKNFYFDKSIKNDIVNSLLQRQFMLNSPEIYGIFNIFERYVSNGDLDNINRLLDNIKKNINIDEYLVKNNVNYDQFINQIMKGKLGVLHQITNRYIAYKREEYVRSRIKDIDSRLKLDKVVTREAYKKDYIEKYGILIPGKAKRLDKNLFNERQLKLLNDDMLFTNILQIKRFPRDYKMTSEQKIYLKELSGILDILYDNKVDFNCYIPEYNNEVSYTFVQKEVSIDFLLGILVESNYDGLLSIINNEELFNKLNIFLDKYKIMGWDKTFEDVLKDCDIRFEEGTVAGLISNFDKISPKIDSKATLTSIIDYGNCYSSVSNFYYLLFGKEDYNLIVANEGKNKASLSKYKRLEGNALMISDMYSRKEITVPSINQEFYINDDKSIGVVLGNTTNMINLTYGERTNSCLRMGGAFDDLYHYCIQDKNGFHIRFVDPETGKFISRVSGIRNGNTVFLNELRDSVDDRYSNDDLYKSLKKVADYIVSETKDSSFPIDNVLVTSDYALKEHDSECQNIRKYGYSMKDAFRGLNFNIMGDAIILASSNSDNSLVPYKFSDDVPVYETVRDNVKIYEGEDAINRMSQLRMINDLLNENPDKNTEIDSNFDYVVSGEDFYIAFKNDKPNIFIMDKFKNDIRTNKEVADVLKNSKKYFNTDNRGRARR